MNLAPLRSSDRIDVSATDHKTNLWIAQKLAAAAAADTHGNKLSTAFVSQLDLYNKASQSAAINQLQTFIA